MKTGISPLCNVGIYIQSRAPNQSAYVNSGFICKFEPRFMLTEKVGVLNQSSVDACAELLHLAARCTRAHMSSQLDVKRPVLLGAAVRPTERRGSNRTRHGGTQHKTAYWYFLSVSRDLARGSTREKSRSLTACEIAHSVEATSCNSDQRRRA